MKRILFGPLAVSNGPNGICFLMLHLPDDRESHFPKRRMKYASDNKQVYRYIIIIITVRQLVLHIFREL
jgi:hypothetical protein